MPGNFLLPHAASDPNAAMMLRTCSWPAEVCIARIGVWPSSSECGRWIQSSKELTAAGLESSASGKRSMPNTPRMRRTCASAINSSKPDKSNPVAYGAPWANLSRVAKSLAAAFSGVAGASSMRRN